MKRLGFLLCISAFVFTFSCAPTPEKSEINKVVMRESSDASTLNPVNAGDELSSYLSMQLYQFLLATDYETEKIVGIVASSIPEIEVDSSNKMKLHYTIRPEAKFDNGRKITAEDVLFTIKLNICPLVNNGYGSYYYGFIEDVLYSAESPDKFTIVCKSAVALNIFRSGDYALMPYEVYDTNRVLKNYSIAELQKNEGLKTDEKLINFAKQFSEMTKQSSPEYFKGSGPYRLKKWQKGERIILEKKENWWGKKYENENTYFKVNADELHYEIINDPVTAITALKSGQVDFMRSVPNSDFAKLEESEKLSKKSELKVGYQYIGFNTNDEILKEKTVRKAIAAALPLDEIIRVVYEGMATKNRLPLPLQQKEMRNTELKHQGYDLQKAKELLQSAGWYDTDNNGVLDKQVEGNKKELRLTYHYNTGNNERKSVGLLLKNELKKLGIELEVINIEWVSYLKALKNNEVDIFMSGFTSLPLPPDFSNSFHSSNANGGRNYANYQNPKVDSLIELINIELDEDRRNQLVKQFQSYVIEDVPYLFLLTSKTNIVFSRSLQNVPVYSQRPGFWAPELY